MANRQRGELTLKVQKDRYTLRLTTNSVCELEDFVGAQNKKGVGRTWVQVLNGVDNGSMKDVRLFMWVALRQHHPDIASDDLDSLKAVGTIIDRAGGLMKIIQTITALVALNADAPGEDDEKEQDAGPRPPDAQTGIGEGFTPTHSPLV